MQHYDSNDSKFGRNLRKGAPDDFAAFVEFDQQVFADEGHTLSKKTRELIAIGVAATTQCPHCIEIHSRGAAKAGATQEELSEAIMVAMALRAGGAMTHGWMATKYYEDEVSANED